MYKNFCFISPWRKLDTVVNFLIINYVCLDTISLCFYILLTAHNTLFEFLNCFLFTFCSFKNNFVHYFINSVIHDFNFTLQVVSNKSTNEVPRDTPDLDEEMERVFAGVSSGSGTNRFDLSRFTSDRSPKPGGRRFSEDDYTSKSLSIISLLVCRWF